MKKTVRIIDIDCPVCASKIEGNIAKIDGVNEVSLNFVAQRMSIDFDESKYDLIKEKVLAEAKKVEPDCKIIGF